MSFFKEIFGGKEKPKYSFELVNNSLLREDRNQIAQLITQVNAAESPEQKMGPWTELVTFVSERFADVKVSADDDSVSNFISTFAQLPQKQNYNEATTSVVGNPEQKINEDSSGIEMSTTEINSAGRVMPTRVTPWSQFEGVEPVAQATVITPAVISAQQRGLGVTTTPEQRQENGEAAMARLIAEAEDAPSRQVTEVYISPYERDKPNHFAQNDSLPGDANIDWSPAGPETVVHPKPPEHLVK